jgi:hypothetical protein
MEERRRWGPDHSDVGNRLGNFAAFLQAQRQAEQARPLAERALARGLPS